MNVEVVGSTAWGGEVPQSDLDLVLVTASANSSPPQAEEKAKALVGSPGPEAASDLGQEVGK